MRHFSLSEYLNRENQWTSRLFGMETFQKYRDAEQINKEYQHNKWGALLKQDLNNPKHAKSVELEILAGKGWQQSKTVFSMGNELFETTGEISQESYFSLIRARQIQIGFLL